MDFRKKITARMNKKTASFKPGDLTTNRSWKNQPAAEIKENLGLVEEVYEDGSVKIVYPGVEDTFDIHRPEDLIKVDKDGNIIYETVTQEMLNDAWDKARALRREYYSLSKNLETEREANKKLMEYTNMMNNVVIPMSQRSGLKYEKGYYDQPYFRKDFKYSGSINFRKKILARLKKIADSNNAVAKLLQQNYLYVFLFKMIDNMKMEEKKNLVENSTVMTYRGSFDSGVEFFIMTNNGEFFRVNFQIEFRMSDYSEYNEEAQRFAKNVKIDDSPEAQNKYVEIIKSHDEEINDMQAKIQESERKTEESKKKALEDFYGSSGGEITRGDKVKVIRRMKGKNSNIPVGTEGVVKWVGQDSYNPNERIDYKAYRYDPINEKEVDYNGYVEVPVNRYGVAIEGNPKLSYFPPNALQIVEKGFDL